MRFFQKSSALLAALTIGLSLMSAPAAAQAPALPQLGSPIFARFWARADYPVAAGMASRTYYFGPEAILTCEEAYQEAPGGRRLVTYLDKARLELNNPSSGVVTGGLLAKELISGKMQVGDNAFQDLPAAAVPVAGDPVASNAPAYESFAPVSSIDPTKNRAQPRQGQTVIETLDRAGQPRIDTSLERYGVKYVDYRSELGHNIPNVFIDFFLERGLVAQVQTSGEVTVGEDQLIDWVQVMGLPIAEPYWAVVPVGGVEKWVLMQPFERRVVTYTPDNDPAFRVEMGNIGQHYKLWRHPDGTCQDRESRPQFAVPDGKSATVENRVGPWGTIFRLRLTGFQPGEPVSFWLTTPDGTVAGTPAPVNAGNHSGAFADEWATNQGWKPGLWAVTYQGDASGHQAIGYFYVTDRPAPPTPPAAVPDGKNGSVTPKYGWQGTIFRATISGFKSNEPISFWLTAPDGSVAGTPRPVGSQHNGSIQGLAIRTNEAFDPGLWSITFQGDSSGNQSIVYFYIVK